LSRSASSDERVVNHTSTSDGIGNGDSAVCNIGLAPASRARMAVSRHAISRRVVVGAECRKI
jgi:hypothetical protein